MVPLPSPSPWFLHSHSYSQFLLTVTLASTLPRIPSRFPQLRHPGSRAITNTVSFNFLYHPGFCTATHTVLFLPSVTLIHPYEHRLIFFRPPSPWVSHYLKYTVSFSSSVTLASALPLTPSRSPLRHLGSRPLADAGVRWRLLLLQSGRALQRRAPHERLLRLCGVPGGDVAGQAAPLHHHELRLPSCG